MSGVNKVILVGRLGKDPEIRYMPNGEPVANATMATSETWKDKNSGQKQEKTEWHRVVFFGGVAKIVAEYVKKGSNIYIEGKLQTRKWQNQEGKDQYTTEIVVDGFKGVMQMLSPVTRGGQDGGQNQQHNQNQGQQQPQQNNQRPAQQPQQGYQTNTNQQQQPTQQGNQPFEDEFDDDIQF